MDYLLLLGGNLGNVDQTMLTACGMLSSLGRLDRVSAIYESPAWGFDAPEPFHNMAVLLVSHLLPGDLLDALKQIEIDLGRKHKTIPGQPYSSRNIDIDILCCADRVVDTPDLQIPHPRLHLRGFALTPLAEICPEWRHPLLDMSVREMIDHLPEGESLAKPIA